MSSLSVERFWSEIQRLSASAVLAPCFSAQSCTNLCCLNPSPHHCWPAVPQVKPNKQESICPESGIIGLVFPSETETMGNFRANRAGTLFERNVCFTDLFYFHRHSHASPTQLHNCSSIPVHILLQNSKLRDLCVWFTKKKWLSYHLFENWNGFYCTMFLIH